MKNKKKPRCHNCQFAGRQFKINKLTHLHCAEPTKYNQGTFDKGEFCAWDTLRVFNDTCEYHEFKEVANTRNKQIKLIGINMNKNKREYYKVKETKTASGESEFKICVNKRICPKASQCAHTPGGMICPENVICPL